MGKDYTCPGCQKPVDGGAIVCPNSDCRKDLAFCSHCRDITTYELISPGTGRFGRDKFKCARCERPGVRCLTWAAGGYCNGLARSGGRWDHALCARCNERVSEVGRSVVGWTLIGALGGLVRRK
jgi:hypothetical protein